MCYNPQTEQHECANAALSVDCNIFVVCISYRFWWDPVVTSFPNGHAFEEVAVGC